MDSIFPNLTDIILKPNIETFSIKPFSAAAAYSMIIEFKYFILLALMFTYRTLLKYVRKDSGGSQSATDKMDFYPKAAAVKRSKNQPDFDVKSVSIIY